MATSSNKVSLLPELTTPASEDLLYVIDDPNGTPTSKKLKLQNLFGDLTSNISMSKTFTLTGDLIASGNNWNVSTNTVTYKNLTVTNFVVSSNSITISSKFTPANSSVFETGSEGKIYIDNSYIYVKTANNVIKRVALTSF